MMTADQPRAAYGGLSVSPEIILPAQFFRQDLPRSVWPEMQLVAAIINEALTTFAQQVGRNSNRARAEVRDVLRWVASDRRDYPFAFLTVCDLLDLDPQRLRRKLNEWRNGAAVPQDIGNLRRRRTPNSRGTRPLRLRGSYSSQSTGRSVSAA